MNTELIQKVYNHLIGDMNQLNMHRWVINHEGLGDVPGVPNDVPDTGCGTVACIAGHALIMSDQVVITEECGDRYWVPAEGRSWKDGGQYVFGLGSRAAEYLFLHTDDHEAVNALRVLLETEDEREMLFYLAEMNRRTNA